jgi:glutamine amidotransferase
MHLSHDHPDGWGLAYYVAGSPHVIKSESSAVSCNLFKRVSGIARSETVLAHLRKATAGSVEIANTHPFQYGSWVFAHNGNIKDLALFRPAIEAKVEQRLRSFILGTTDSELIFYFLLTHIARRVSLARAFVDIDSVMLGVKEALAELRNIIGDFNLVDGPPSETYLTFILTNGSTLIAHQGGKDLFFSTYKKNCVDRDLCSSYAPECENESKNGLVNHLLFSSEEIKGDNIWIKMIPGQLIGVDGNMKLERENSLKTN